jgi:hypothetical protein
MQGNQLLGFIAGVLVIIVVLLAYQVGHNSHRTVGDALHDTVQEMKESAPLK